MIGGVVMFQQSPPVHTTGARFDAAPLRTVLREISESRAARIIAEREALASGKATDKQRAAISRIDDGATPAAQRMRRLRARKAQP